MSVNWQKLVTTLIENKYPFVKIVDFEERTHRIKNNHNPGDNTTGYYYALKIKTDKSSEPESNLWPFELERYIYELGKYVGERLITEFIG